MEGRSVQLVTPAVTAMIQASTRPIEWCAKRAQMGQCQLQHAPPVSLARWGMLASMAFANSVGSERSHGLMQPPEKLLLIVVLPALTPRSSPSSEDGCRRLARRALSVHMAEHQNVENTVCDVCVPGKISEVGVSCEYCPVGSEPNTIAFDVGATHCLACVNGTHRHNEETGGALDMQSCSTCSAGQQPNDAADDCESCSAIGNGMFSADGAACIRCDDGTSPNATKVPVTYVQRLRRP